MITRWLWIGCVDARDLARTRLSAPFRIDSARAGYDWRVVGGAYILALFANEGSVLSDADKELALNLCYAKYGGEE